MASVRNWAGAVAGAGSACIWEVPIPVGRDFDPAAPLRPGHDKQGRGVSGRVFDSVFCVLCNVFERVCGNLCKRLTVPFGVVAVLRVTALVALVALVAVTGLVVTGFARVRICGVTVVFAAAAVGFARHYVLRVLRRRLRVSV